MGDVKKVQLPGGPDNSVTWIWLDPAGGQLKVEYYDFSEPAQKFFGNDIAWTITVEDMQKLYSTVSETEGTLIAWMERYFKSYFGIKQWLDENGIVFRVERESWA